MNIKKYFLQMLYRRRLRGIYQKFKQYTMIPERAYIDNLILCDKFQHIAGDIVECGVWKGGMTAGIADLLGKKKNYYLFDSFEGLPPVQPIDGKKAKAWQYDISAPTYYDNCKASRQDAAKAMQIAGIENAEIVQGWFEDSLKNIDKNLRISILRLDADWYASTMCCLENLYPLVSPHGVIIIDDYYAWEGCAKAVHDFLSKNKLSDRIYQTRENIAYIIKNG